MFEGYIAGKLANKMFEEDVFKTVKRHAAIGSILMAIPDFGFGGIIYIVVLWHMYSSIANKIGFSFKENFWKLVGFGFIVNVAIAFVIDIVLTTLFFIEPFLIYLQFYLSGKLFIESLKSYRDISNNTQEQQPLFLSQPVHASPQQMAELNSYNEDNEIKESTSSTKSDEFVFCTNCGAKQPADNPYCTECGAKLHLDNPNSKEIESIQIDETTLIACPGCGELVSQATEYCPNCGTVISVKNQNSEKDTLLHELEELRNTGILTEEEYNQQKEQIINNDYE